MSNYQALDMTACYIQTTAASTGKHPELLPLRRQPLSVNNMYALRLNRLPGRKTA